jgi:hypothetical protein
VAFGPSLLPQIRQIVGSVDVASGDLVIGSFVYRS